MADQTRLVQFDGKQIAFPADATDAEISAALNAIPAENADHAPKANTWMAIGMRAVPPEVGMAAAKNAASLAARGAAEVATNPNVPRLAATAGRVVGAVSPVAVGAMEGGPVGAVAGMAASARGAWAGGKTGYFTGKLAQQIAAPVATALEKFAPYAQTVSTLGGAQAINDLAQTVEPNRSDIGFLGMASSLSLPAQRAAVMNMQIRALQDQGISLATATSKVYNAWADYLKANKAK